MISAPSPLSLTSLASFWSQLSLETNVVVFMNLCGALFLGSVVGYERTWRGRAAGMRTYGLVCMVSAGLVAITGQPSMWYGTHETSLLVTLDPTRVIQGLVTGIGFLGAGLIMRDGFTISGLTTAASIWVVTAIGVCVGTGFYAAAILLTVLTLAFMILGAHFESKLPARNLFAVTLRFAKGTVPVAESVYALLSRVGYKVGKSGQSLKNPDNQWEWHFLIYSKARRNCLDIGELARVFPELDSLETFHIAYARN